MEININGRLVKFDGPQVMGIINITSDSFFAGSRYRKKDEIIARTRQIINEGGSMVDVGGCSTRPGAEVVSEQEELDRVTFAVSAIREEFPDIPISVDSFRSKVADISVRECGASIINDISGGELDADMFDVVSKLGVPYILMHSKGDPKTMVNLTDYDDYLKDIFMYFAKKLDELRRLGVKDIIVDPGFGFAKTLEQNYELLASCDMFSQLNCPILIGISRKRMIWQLLNSSADEALNGTTVLNTLSLLKGADILRVHDVRAAVETIKIVNMYKKFLNSK